MVLSKIIIAVLLFHIFLPIQVRSSIEHTWVKVGFYWYAKDYLFPISDINSALFAHMICAYAGVNTTSYEVSLPSSAEHQFSIFTETVKKKNPSVITLLSTGGKEVNFSTLSAMASNASFRKSFIDSSIKSARLYGFQGLDLHWKPNNSIDMYNMGVLFEEWRAAVHLEARNANQSQLILTAWVEYSPSVSSGSYPIEKIQQYLDWVHVSNYNRYWSPNVTAAPAALYDPSSFVSTDYGITAWIDGGLPANKLVLSLPYYGYTWTLENPGENGIGAPAKGPAITSYGQLTYKQIKHYINQYGPNVHIIYNSTYVVNYCTIGTYWISFDDVEAVRAKVSYAKEKTLLGYSVWQVSYDVDWVLSQAAAEVDLTISSSDQEENTSGHRKRWLIFVIVFTTIAAVSLGIFVIYYCWRRKLKLKGTADLSNQSNGEVNNAAASGDFNSNVPHLIEYTLDDIEASTNGFSIENKLGQGGYGPVFKGILPGGQEIAVKKLSKTSTQGFEEFKNEVMLTAKLQHVNLVPVLGFCMDREEQILIYEYMPNKSLDSYLFDPIRKYILDWNKRVHIIEGVTQGLLYLQEYSRLTIIHRDLKVSNILLDGDMKPKISDFGMARIFAKHDLEANTSRIVGTLGYAPPEYLKRGIYSIKSDVYSFGVLLLQVTSGKRISLFYGVNESLSLLEYGYQLWKEGKGMEFMDESLDDTNTSCKLTICLQIALLCVQENPNDRPSMLEVFFMLKNETTDMMIPKRPAFSKQNEEYGMGSGSVNSVNDVTVSEIVAR